MSITADTAVNQLEVIVEDEDDSYKKHFYQVTWQH